MVYKRGDSPYRRGGGIKKIGSSSQQNSKNGRDNLQDKLSRYISCPFCKKPGHNANQCWNKPSSGNNPTSGNNSTSGNNNSNRQKPGWKSCDTCGKPGHTASECWNRPGASPNKCATCGKIGHASEACWFKQGRASNSNKGDSDDSGSYKSGSNDSGGSYKSGSNDSGGGSSNGSSNGGSGSYKSGSQQSGSSHQSNKTNQAQNVSIWGRPLKCVVASADGVIQTPYNPPLRVAERKGDDFWAVDADGDVLMCTVCSGRNLPGEWCLQDCMARIGRQQHADSPRIQKADESGLQRAMKENFCPKRELAGTLGKHTLGKSTPGNFTLGNYVVGKRVS